MIAFKVRSPDPRIPSYRYRCLAPIRMLTRRGFEAVEFRQEDIDSYSLVVFSKVYDQAHDALARELQGRGVRVVLDLCDNHFYNPFGLEAYRRAREDLRRMILLADQVICSTSTLADIVVQQANPRRVPEVIGDPVDISPRPSPPRSDTPPRLLWFGHHGSPNAPSGMTDLLRISDTLRRVCDVHPVEVMVASNNRRKFENSIAPLPLRTTYVDWRLETFPAVLASAWAVVLPITPNPFTRCKTNNRAATALAAGVPVVADRIPSYDELAPFCYLDNWEGGLRTVLNNPREARLRASGALSFLERNWSEEVVGARWEAVLGDIPITR